MSEVKRWWVKAQGNQLETPVYCQLSADDCIDISERGEDRWIATIIQTVDPTNNPRSMTSKWMSLVKASDYDAIVKERDELRAFQELGMATRLGMYADVLKECKELREENARLREALAALSKRHDWTPGMGECICSEHMAAREILSRDEAKQGDE